MLCCARRVETFAWDVSFLGLIRPPASAGSPELASQPAAFVLQDPLGVERSPCCFSNIAAVNWP